MFFPKASVFFAFLAGLFFAGCSTGGGQIDRLQIGMNKAQVVAVMGEPDHVVASGSEMNLVYYLHADDGLGKRGYVVQLVDDKVRSFGKMLTMIVPSPAESVGGPTVH